jgi:CRISPR-associated protein Cas5
MDIDLSLLLEKPAFDTKAVLTIEALSPLSIVVSLPGKYYRSQQEPTDLMQFAIIENIMGWHFGEIIRKEIIKKVKDSNRKDLKFQQTGSGYINLLQNHIKIENKVIPDSINYDDLWSQHLKHNDERHIKGSRNYSWKIEKFVNNVKNGEEKIEILKNKIDFYPHYYISPTPREYIIPKGLYKYLIASSKEILNFINNYITDPVSPPYLGSNDGWINLIMEIINETTN